MSKVIEPCICFFLVATSISVKTCQTLQMHVLAMEVDTGVLIEILEPHIYIDILVAKKSFFHSFDLDFHVKK
jgi:hypothetical protein